MANAVKQATIVETGSLHGPGAFEIWKVFDAELVASTGVVDSVLNTANTRLGFNVARMGFFGLHISATSVSGTAQVGVSLIQSWDDTSANYAVLGAGGTVVSALAETTTNYALTPVPMRFLRLRLTGGASNPADTIVTGYLFMQR